MRIVIIKNNQATLDTYCGQDIASVGTYQIQNDIELSRFSIDEKVNLHIWNEFITINDGINDLTPLEGDRWLKGNYLEITTQPDPMPFAQPLYRTKRNSTPDIVTVQPNSSNVVDFLITEELYVSGGRLIVVGAQMGDYITAEVNDKDGNIPEAYRSTLCEDWPTVNKYIVKEWVDPTANNEVNTYPLNAKIPAGVYLRVTYFACADGSDRKVAMNYYLTKKL